MFSYHFHSPILPQPCDNKCPVVVNWQNSGNKCQVISKMSVGNAQHHFSVKTDCWSYRQVWKSRFLWAVSNGIIQPGSQWVGEIVFWCSASPCKPQFHQYLRIETMTSRVISKVPGSSVSQAYRSDWVLGSAVSRTVQLGHLWTVVLPSVWWVLWPLLRWLQWGLHTVGSSNECRKAHRLPRLRGWSLRQPSIYQLVWYFFEDSSI